MPSLPLPFVLATRNVDKAREIIEILVEHSGFPLVAYAVDVGDVTVGLLVEHPERVAAVVAALQELRVAPDVEETGATLEANARIKAAERDTSVGSLVREYLISFVEREPDFDKRGARLDSLPRRTPP